MEFLDLLDNFLVLNVGQSMAAQFPVGLDAVLQVFHHLVSLIILFCQFLDAGVQFFLAVQVVPGEKRHGFCQLFEIENLGPVLVACALACGQLGLNVNQAADAVGVRIRTVEFGGFLSFGILCENSQNFLFGKIIAQLAGGDGLGPAGGEVTEPAAALTNRDAMLLQKLSGKFLQAGSLGQNRTNLPAKGRFLGFIFGLPDRLTGSGCLLVGILEAALAAPLRPVFLFGNPFAGAVQQVDLVESGLLAKLHGLDPQVPEHRGSAAVLHAFLPVTGLFHIGLPRDGPYSDAADDNVNVDIASSIVSVGVGADDGGMTRKVFLAELQAKGLSLFQGQSVVRSVPRVEADDILVSLHIVGREVLSVLPVCQQAGHGKGLPAAFQGVQ